MSNDPDDRATATAAAEAKRLLAERGIFWTDKEAFSFAFRIIFVWIQARTCNWATRRGTPKVGYPDAMTVGFCEAVLGLIWDRLFDLPRHLPLIQWAKNDVARMGAIFHDAIEESRIQTLEDPSDEVPA